MQKIILLNLLVLLMIGCSTTNTLTLNTVNPPIVHTPKSATKIGIIDRTANKSSADKIFNKLEEILSAETFSIDRKAVNRILEGFGSQVTNYSKFENAKIIDFKDPSSITMQDFPKLMDWEYIETLCTDNDVDIIVELSFLDSDSDIDYSTRDREINVPIIGTKTVMQHIAEVQTRLLCGWRIYDPSTRQVADEFRSISDFGLRGEGINPLTALQEILKSRQLILSECRILGDMYAKRLQPYNLRVTRKYFVKGNDNFKTARRYSEVGDWEEAAKYWMKDINNPDAKLRGRANYNMAIISEIRGDIKKAIEWASKAYAESGIDLALRYVNVLKDRANSNKYMEENY